MKVTAVTIEAATSMRCVDEIWERATAVMEESHRAARHGRKPQGSPSLGESHRAAHHGREPLGNPSWERGTEQAVTEENHGNGQPVMGESHHSKRALHVKERRGCPSQERATGAASNEIEPQATRHRRESQGQPIMGERLRGSPSAQGQPIMGERLRVSPSWERATEAARHGREPQGCSSRKRATGQPVIEKNHRLTRHWRELQGSPS